MHRMSASRGAGARRSDLAGQGSFTAFYVDEGRVTAALTVGRSDDLDHAQRFMRSGETLDAGALADEGTDLGSL